jgi:Flp pilus assembly protein TadD
MDLWMRSQVGVTDEDAPRVARDMRKAAAAWPNDPAVQAALAEAEFDAGDLDAADSAAARAIAADPKNIEALIYRAKVGFERAKASKAGDEGWKAVRKLIGQANRADHNHPEPLMLYYQSFVEQGAEPARLAVSGLHQAFALAPQDFGLRMTAARQLLVDGKAADARRALAPIAYDPHGGTFRQAVAGVIAKLDSDGASAALDALDAATAEAEKKAEKKPS